MDGQIKSQFSRARELYQELGRECEQRKGETQVHPRILNLAVEILSKLRSILDHAAFSVFEKKLVPLVVPGEARKVKVYFPIADDQESFKSQLGRSELSLLEKNSPATYDILRTAQPFASENNRWLAAVRDLSNEGKHVKLVSQERHVTKRTTVSGPGGSVRWGNGVTFGPGVSIMGAPIDPKTQEIVPTPGVTSTSVYLISFEFSNTRVNALGFLAEAIDKVEALTTNLLASL